ncbi:unnamed protein product [Trichogramma brassicae]|uniref:Uncharacterized protein n=1 Tax=Trichogramma brassicae TaxID=86971 RepID=A0A6H5IE24_9HYME|nr:unnamed protein product [Trichogramma brassicae]
MCIRLRMCIRFIRHTARNTKSFFQSIVSTEKNLGDIGNALSMVNDDFKHTLLPFSNDNRTMYCRRMSLRGQALRRGRLRRYERAVPAVPLRRRLAQVPAAGLPQAAGPDAAGLQIRAAADHGARLLRQDRLRRRRTSRSGKK